MNSKTLPLRQPQQDAANRSRANNEPVRNRRFEAVMRGVLGKVTAVRG